MASGSKGQSVTGANYNHDYNSLWTLKEAHGQTEKYVNDLIKCDDVSIDISR